MILSQTYCLLLSPRLGELNTFFPVLLRIIKSKISPSLQKLGPLLTRCAKRKWNRSWNRKGRTEPSVSYLVCTVLVRNVCTWTFCIGRDQFADTFNTFNTRPTLTVHRSAVTVTALNLFSVCTKISHWWCRVNI